MNNLIFIWQAIFLNGDSISQFENGIENKFQLVKDRFNELKYFILKHKKNSIQFTVDLENGLISNNFDNIIKQESKEFKNKLRLIHFRRHKVEIGTEDLKQKKHEIIYFLGFQYNDKLGNNRQIVLQIDEEGNFIIGS